MITISAELLKLTRRQIKRITNDPLKSAKAVNLRYVSDNRPGIIRMKKQDTFIYLYKGIEITDEDKLIRIKKLVLPPAWKNVWICRNVCKKYYVHPSIITLYETNRLPGCLSLAGEAETKMDESGLTRDEQIVLKILNTIN
jgi:DNA topoisomerase IB